MMRVDVLDRGNIEDDHKHSEDKGHQEGGVQLEDGLAVEPQHVQELGVDKESVSQAMRVDTQSTEVGHDHDRDQAIQDVTLGVVGDDSGHRVGDAGDEQS